MKKIFFAFFITFCFCPLFAKQNEDVIENTPQELEAYIEDFFKAGHFIKLYDENSKDEITSIPKYYSKEVVYHISFTAKKIQFYFYDYASAIDSVLTCNLDDVLIKIDGDNNLIIID
ncbi:MAG: hypothetical protein K6C97_04680 [Treponema sp.]|nr:hypothetical protein [Treponema sp.]